jgi:hypothetical protein
MGISIFPTPDAGGGGGYNFELISSINMATGSPASISFTGIDPKYKTLKLVIGQTASSATRELGIRINAVSSNHSWLVRRLSGSTWATGDTANANRIFLVNAANAGTQTYEIYLFDTNLLAPTNVSFNGTGGGTYQGWGNFNQATVVNEITILHDGGQTFTDGTAYLLGSES